MWRGLQMFLFSCSFQFIWHFLTEITSLRVMLYEAEWLWAHLSKHWNSFKMWGNVRDRGCTVDHTVAMVHESGIAPTTLVLITGPEPALATSAPFATYVQTPGPAIPYLHCFRVIFYGRIPVLRSRRNCTAIILLQNLEWKECDVCNSRYCAHRMWCVQQ